jgi:hypothetical protein
MKRSAIVLVFFIVGMHLPTIAQKKKKTEIDTVKEESFIVQPKRIEFEIGSQDEDFFVVSAGEKGLLVVKQTSRREKSGFIWELYLVDSALNVIWNRVVVVDYGSDFMGYDYSENGFYLLYGKNEYKKEEMKVYAFGLETGDISGYDIKLALPLDLSEFEVVGNSLIFGGISNFRPVITLLDLDDLKPKVLPGIYNEKSSILEIRIDEIYNNFTVVMSERTHNKQVTISLKTFTEKGELVHTTALETDMEKSLLDGVSTNFDNGSQYVSGTYAKKKSEYSRGLYLSKLELGEQQFIKYYDYGALENFFSYMSAKREGRVKERIERKEVKGKKTKFNYRLHVNDIIERDNEYILIGEAYYPKYSNYTNNSSSSAYDYGAGYYNPNFIGYKYTHAVVVGFSKNGKVLWDNSFEINDLLSFTLKENVHVSVEKERIVLLYVYEDVIRSKIIKGEEIVEGKSFDPVALHFKSDEIRNHGKEMGGLEKWFEGNFYTYGIQNIKNMKDSGVKLNRRVFYINKVQYH